MASISNPYLLPKRNLPGFDDNAFDPKQFKNWVEALPVGDVAGTANQIHDQLKEMNSCEFPVADRMRNLELILKPFLFVMDGLAASYSSETLPPGKRLLHLVKLRASLYLLIVRAYKIVLDQYHRKSLAGRILHKHNRALALHRSIYFLGKSLLHAYRLYQPAPKYIWQEINGIYHYAVEQHLSDKALESEDRRMVDHSTVSDLYKQILLLSLACPYRFLKGEVTHVYMALSQWAPRCQLRALKSGAEALFIVDSGSDEPPRYREEVHDSTIKLGWLIDTDDLAIKLAGEFESLHAQIGVMRPQDAPDTLSSDLFARLILTWGAVVQRSADRFESQGQASLFCNLNLLYSMFGGEEAPELFATGFKVATISAEEAIKGEDARWVEEGEHIIDGGKDLARFKKWIEENAGRGASPPVPDARADKDDTCSRECMVFDESARGYHLGWYGKGDSLIRVGELVGIRLKSDVVAGELQLGVVRWMQSDELGILSFGVEIFSGEVEPVILRRDIKGWDVPVSWRGFLLNSDTEESALIAPPFYSAEESVVELVQGKNRREIHLNRMIEATASFTQLHFMERAESSGKAPLFEKKGTAGVDVEIGV